MLPSNLSGGPNNTEFLRSYWDAELCLGLPANVKLCPASDCRWKQQ